MLQWSGTAWFESDRFYRGVSQSSGHPSVGAVLNLDHRSGAYGGLSVATVELVPGSRRAQTLLYAGLARRLGEGRWSWDLGVQDIRFQDHSTRHYQELYASLGGPPGSLRLHWSPDYYGMGRAAQYLSWQHGGTMAWLPAPAGGGWRWSAHAGVLHWPRELPGQRRWRADGQAGVALDLGRFTLEGALVAAQRSTSLYPSSYELYYGSRAARVHGLLRVSAGF